MKKLLMMVLVTLAAVTLGACQASSASLTDVRLCDNADSEGNCSSDMSKLQTDAEVIYLSAQLENAPSGTTVTATWKYLGGEEGIAPQDIDTVSSTTDESGSMPYYSSLQAGSGGWPVGEYEVVLSLGTENSQPVSKKFTIK